MFAATMLVGWLAVCSTGRAGSTVWADGVRSWESAIFDLCTNMSIVFGYMLCYCLTVAFLRARSAEERADNQSAGDCRVARSGDMPGAVPGRLSRIAAIGWTMLPWYLLGSPMVLLTSESNEARHMAGPFVIGWLLLCVLLSAPWLFGQWRRFVPYEPSKETPAVAEGQASRQLLYTTAGCIVSLRGAVQDVECSQRLTGAGVHTEREDSRWPLRSPNT